MSLRQSWYVGLSALMGICGLSCSGSVAEFFEASGGLPLILSDRTDLHDVPFGAIFTPQNFPDSDLQDIKTSFSKADSLGSILCYIWEWGGGDQGLIDAQILAEEARRRGFKLLLQFGPQMLGDVTPPPGLGSNSFTDPVIQERYINDAVRLAELQPDWLVLATEINLLLRGGGQGEFDAFVQTYQRAYTAVKEVAPETVVGVSYHHTLLVVEKNFEIIDQMGPQDFIGLTTYPDALVLDGYYESVDDFPNDFYSILLEKFSDKPFAFTEIGFTTRGDITQENQARFALRLPELMGPMNPLFASWAMLHDVPAFDVRFLTDQQRQAIQQRFGVSAETLFGRLNHMGLFETSGLPKRAYHTVLSVFGGH